MKNNSWQLTKWWQKAVCALGIPLLVNTIAATYFLNLLSVAISLSVTALFIHDVIKRRRGKIIWDLDDRWERTVYVIAWISTALSITIVLMSLAAGSL